MACKPALVRTRLLVILLLSLVTSVLSLSRGAAESPTTFAIRFVVAQADGQPVVSTEWLDQHVEWANRIFAPASLRFVKASTEPHGGRSEIITRSHRHELSHSTHPQVINAFVVQALGDVDRRGEFIRGVHWRSRRGCNGVEGCQRHYVILSSIARSTVLAHELGHFFGNPHSDTPGNIMSYTRGAGPPFLDAAQIRRIKAYAVRFTASGELVVK